MPPLLSVMADPDSPWGEVLAVDGVVDRASSITLQKSQRWLTVENPNTAEQILNMRVRAVRSFFDSVIIPLHGTEPISRVHINWQVPTNYSGPTIWFSIPFDLRTWDHPWTPPEFADSLKSVVARHSLSEISILDPIFVNNGPGALVFKIDPADQLIRNVVQRHLPTALMLFRENMIRLQRRRERKVTLTFSQLPERVSFAVQQYLLYLYQFLSDLGIEVMSEVNCEAGQILFTLTPLFKTQALHRINRALQLYLQLPSASEFSVLTRATPNPALIDLCTSVDLLKERMSALEHRIEIVETQKCRYMINAHPSDSEPVKDDKEPLIKGLINVLPFRKFGLDLELPRMLRALKRRIRRLDRDKP